MSVVSAFLSAKEFSKLLLRGKEQGFLTPEEINDAIPASIVEYADIDQILIKLEEMNITINKVDEDEESEMSEIDLIDEALSASEAKELKSSSSPQIGLSKRIFVVDVDYDREETAEGSGEYTLSNFTPRIFINPKFKLKEGDITYQEGCLSLPGVYEDVKRYEHIVVEYQNTNGEVHEIEAHELLSICIQHENDHLDGIVFIDRLSNLKKNFFKKKLIKQKKLQTSV